MPLTGAVVIVAGLALTDAPSAELPAADGQRAELSRSFDYGAGTAMLARPVDGAPALSTAGAAVTGPGSAHVERFPFDR